MYGSTATGWSGKYFLVNYLIPAYKIVGASQESHLKTLNNECVRDDFSYEQMLKDLSDPLLPSRAHAIMQLG